MKHHKLESPNLVYFDSLNLRYKPCRWYHIHLWYWLIILAITYMAFMVGYQQRPKLYSSPEYIYFPCSRTMISENNKPRMIWKDINKAFEDSQFKVPIQITIKPQ
jgi:hypothetical protein